MTSLRQKIILGFAAVGAFVVGLSLLAVYEVERMEQGMVAEEAIAALVDAVADLRRAEKNYILYHDPADLTLNRRHGRQIAALLEDHAAPLTAVRAPDLPRRLAADLATYVARVDSYAATPDDANELLVRAAGKDLSAVTGRLADQRRDALHSAVASHRRIVAWVSIGSLVMLGAIGTLLAVRVTRPLAEVQERLEEVAAGRLERLDLPAGDTEIRSLVAATNRLIDELEVRRQQMLVSQKLASLGVLLSGVAHELNNPLSNISSSCQILLEEEAPDSDFLRAHLQQIDDQTQRAARIVATLLDFSRHRRYLKEAVPLRELVADTIALVRGSVPSGVTVDNAVPEDLIVLADRQRLQQVLLNLLRNAAEAANTGGGIAVRGETDGNETRITVSDSGCGIPAAVLPRIFDPFFSTKEVGQGAGLGLFIVHDIIKKHGGTVSASSAPGQGTSFLIRLPARDKTVALAEGR